MDRSYLDIDTLEYDFVILGTGLTELILSSSFSQVFKSVFHIDENIYYGGMESSHTLGSFVDILSQSNSIEFPKNSKSNNEKFDGKFFSYCGVGRNWLKNFVVKSGDVQSNSKFDRNFSIDLTPRLIWTQSKTKDVLIRNGCSRYLEFMIVEKIYTIDESNNLILVPVTKADVFVSKDITLQEKRILTRFISGLEKVDEDLDRFLSEPLVKYLSHKKLTRKLQGIILYSIALESKDIEDNSTISTKEGLNLLKNFLLSVGKFGGHSPWIYPLYGIGDMTQAFCRVGAIHGATYILDRPTLNVEFCENHVNIQISETQTIKCKKLISNFDNANALLSGHLRVKKVFLRAVLILDRPLTEKESAWISIPCKSMNTDRTVFALQLDYRSRVVPNNRYLVHLVCEKSQQEGQTSFQVLSPIVEFFTRDDSPDGINSSENTLHTTQLNQILKEKPILIWAAYYDQIVRELDKEFRVPDNLFLIHDSPEIYDTVERINLAEQIFKEIYPEEEFIPKVPNPEDVIWESTNKDSSEIFNAACERDDSNENVNK